MSFRKWFMSFQKSLLWIRIYFSIFGAWNRNTHMWFRNWYMKCLKYGMLFRVDFGPIAVSKLHMWYQNFTCCFETKLQISEITHCHDGKTGYFRLCSFPFSCMLFRKSLVSFWLCIMLFRNYTMWLRTISYHIFPIISIPWHVKSKLSPVVLGLCHVVSKRHRVAFVLLRHFTMSFRKWCVVFPKYTCHLEKLWCSSNKIHTYS